MNENAKHDGRFDDGNGDELAPAAGGTFGVTEDESGFGQGSATDQLARDRAPLADESGASYSGANYSPNAAAYDSVPRDYADAAEDADENLNTDDFLDASDGYSDAYSSADGSHSGSGHSGYGTSADDPYGSSHGGSAAGQGGYGQYASDHGNYSAEAAAGAAAVGATAVGGAASGGYGNSQQTSNLGPTQYGEQPASGGSADTFAYVALGLALVALLLLCFPGIAWMFGGGLGVLAVIAGFLGTRGQKRQLAWLGVVGGGIAVALAIATAIVVYVV